MRFAFGEVCCVQAIYLKHQSVGFLTIASLWPWAAALRIHMKARDLGLLINPSACASAQQYWACASPPFANRSISSSSCGLNMVWCCTVTAVMTRLIMQLKGPRRARAKHCVRSVQAQSVHSRCEHRRDLCIVDRSGWKY